MGSIIVRDLHLLIMKLFLFALLGFSLIFSTTSSVVRERRDATPDADPHKHHHHHHYNSYRPTYTSGYYRPSNNYYRPSNNYNSRPNKKALKVAALAGGVAGFKLASALG